MYNDSAAAPVDPYSDAYNALPPPSSGPPLDARDRDPPPPRDRSRSRSPVRGGGGGYRSPPPSYPARRRSPPPRPKAVPSQTVTPSKVLGVFGLSIRTTERDLEDEFNRFGRVENVTIVYDQRSDRSRGFGFIKMSAVDEAARCIQELNGVDLNGRRIRVDYSVTERAHAPTPGEYMGHRRSAAGAGAGGVRDSRHAPYRDYRDRDRDYPRDRDREPRRDYDRDRYDRHDRYDRDRERDRDPYGRDSRDWKERRSPPPARGGGGRYSPDRKRRSYSRSPPRGSGSSPARAARDFDSRPPPSASMNGDHRWP